MCLTAYGRCRLLQHVLAALVGWVNFEVQALA